MNFYAFIYILTREKQFQKEFYSIVSGWWWWKKKNGWKAKAPVYSIPPTYTSIVFPRNIAELKFFWTQIRENITVDFYIHYGPEKNIKRKGYKKHVHI